MRHTDESTLFGILVENTDFSPNFFVMLIRRNTNDYGRCGTERFHPFKPEFTIATFIHYKPRIAVAILDL